MIPEEARLQLSRLRPAGALDLKHNEPKYSGYSFLPIGRYTQGVWLCSEKGVMDYVKMQKPYQHRIIDRDDFCVLEMREQKQLFPFRAEMSAFTMQEEQPKGMEMK